MNTARTALFHARFQKALAYVELHLDENLSVEQLSRVAAFSKYHFHRQFSELFGVGVYQYICLCRLKRASFALAFRDDKIIDIAIASQYDSAESFSRAFKKHIGQSPSDFRKHPQWEPWYAAYQPLSELRIQHMKSAIPPAQVRIVNFHATRVAALEHRGDPRTIGDSVRRFIEWRKLNRLPPATSATYNILYDDPAQVAPEDYRLDICVATDRDIAENAYGISEKWIPGGRCAVVRHTGSDDMLSAAIHTLYAQWLPQSGEEPRDFPMFLQRVRFFPDVQENSAISDIYLPIR